MKSVLFPFSPETILEELHSHPELSYQEKATTGRIRSYLESWGIEILETGLETGLVAIIRGKSAFPVVCLRCDIDALPIEEASGLPYSSQNKGVMHACGHDFHTASILTAAYLLKQEQNTLPGTIKLLFQPAEESSHGAESVIASGVLKDVDAIFGLHVSPALPVGAVSTRPGALHASVDRFEIVLEGKGCHAARPQEGIDPIVAAGELISTAQSLVSRNVSPIDSAVVSITHVEAGHTWNVVPSTAYLEGTVRTFLPETRQLLERRLGEVASGIAKSFGLLADYRWHKGPPSTNNDPYWVDVAKEVARREGLNLIDLPASMGGEDFAFYQEKIPGAFVNVGTGEGPSLHHPGFRVDPQALRPAAIYMAELGKEALDRIGTERKDGLQ